MGRDMIIDMVVIELATSLGRQRALSDLESRWLEGAVRREDRRNGKGRAWGPGKVLWQPSDDIALKRHLKRGKKAREIARVMGKTEDSIWSRIRQLRRQGQLPRERPIAVFEEEE